MYRVYSMSTTSWGDKAEIDAKSCSWARSVNGGSSGSAAFKLSDPDVAALVTGGLLEAVDRCLVVEFSGVVVYAGIIWETDYDRDTQTLTVSHEDIWSLLELRLIASDRTSNITKWKQTYSGLKYDTILKRIMQLATSGAGRSVPIQYEDDYTGGSVREYFGYNLDTALDAFNEIIDLADGPDADLRPEWAPGGAAIQWTLRTGGMNPDGQTIEVNFSAEHAAGKNLKVKTSGRDRATQVMGVGEGSGVDMLVRSAGGSGPLSLERAEQAKNIKTGTQLSEFAQGELAVRGSPIRQYGFDVALDSPVVGSLWTLKPGMTVRWHITGDPFLANGWRTSTVLAYSGDIASPWVHFEVQ